MKSWFWLPLATGVAMAMVGCPRRSYWTATVPGQETTYEDTLAKSTYDCISALVEPSSGLPHDRFDAALFDVMPQFGFVRTIPYIDKGSLASLEVRRCGSDTCRHAGDYGLRMEYEMPGTTWASYSMDSPSFDVSKATYLEAWVKGAQGGERFEFVLWGNCDGPFPGRPNSAEIAVSDTWALVRVPLEHFQSYVDLSSLCRLSVGFNSSMHVGGTVYLDEVAFVDSQYNRIHVPLDEETSLTNIGLYIASVLSALDLGLEDRDDAVAKLNTTLTSIEALQKWHGFPQTYDHVVSLNSSESDTGIYTVDLGNLAAGLIILRQVLPSEFGDRAGALLDSMDWVWLYDDTRGLPCGCRYPNGNVSEWHCEWLCADSRLAHFIGIGADTNGFPPGSWNNLNRSQEEPRCKSNNLRHFEPGWDGGGLLMAFLPAIFLDEAQSEMGRLACNFVQDQFCHARQIQAPAWGWSATALPPHGEEYCGWGCVRDEILVAHASILAADCISTNSLRENLRAFEALGAREPVADGNQMFDLGFRSSVNWQTGQVASVYLLLDQSMAFLSLFNHRTHGHIRELFCRDEITRRAIELIPDYVNSCR